MADEEFFMIPRKPGREFGDFPLDLGSVEVVALIPFIVDISWMRGVLPLVPKVNFPISMSEIGEGGAGVVDALVKAAMVDAGR